MRRCGRGVAEPHTPDPSSVNPIEPHCPARRRTQRVSTAYGAWSERRWPDPMVLLSDMCRRERARSFTARRTRPSCEAGPRSRRVSTSWSTPRVSSTPLRCSTGTLELHYSAFRSDAEPGRDTTHSPYFCLPHRSICFIRRCCLAGSFLRNLPVQRRARNTSR